MGSSLLMFSSDRWRFGLGSGLLAFSSGWWGLGFGIEGVDEALEHGGEFFGFLDDFFAVFEFELVELFADFLGDVGLGAEFAAGAFGVTQKACEILGAVTFTSFGDVGGNGDSGGLHLRVEPKVIRILGGEVGVDCESATTFPDFKVFECF